MITIRVGRGANEQSIASFYEWLQEDVDIRRHAQLRAVDRSSKPGEMSLGFDVIELIITSGFSAANLALAYATWRESSSTTGEVVFEKDGASVTVRDASPETVASIVETLKCDED